jgi:hypothetical protein
VTPETSVVTALLPGETLRPGRVLGAVAKVSQQKLFVSLTSRRFLIGKAALTPGVVKFVITNNSRTSRGVVLRGRDVIGSPIVRYTGLVQPRSTTKFSMHLASGRCELVEFHRIGQRDYKSLYKASFRVMR